MLKRYARRWRKNMTLIIGAKCKDGVVILTDTKALRGDDELFETKVLPLFDDKVLLAASGNANLLDKFRRQLIPDIDYMYSQLPEEERDAPIFKGKEDFLTYLERKMRLYKNEYQKDGVSLDLLVGFSEIPATLHFTSTDSPPEEEIHNYLAIGHGAPYSKLLMKTLWKPEMKMIDTASLIFAIIHMIIDLKLDISVGGNIQIYLIPQEGIAHEPTKGEYESIKNSSTKYITNFNRFLKLSSFTPTKDN